MFKCANNGILSLSGSRVQFTGAIDDGAPLAQAKLPECGWLKVVSGGIVKVSNSYTFNPVGDIVMDTTGILDQQKEVDNQGGGWL